MNVFVNYGKNEETSKSLEGRLLINVVDSQGKVCGWCKPSEQCAGADRREGTKIERERERRGRGIREWGGDGRESCIYFFVLSRLSTAPQ